MNVLADEKRLSVLAALLNGNSERAVERMTGVNRKTIRKLAQLPQLAKRVVRIVLTES